jgi:hypothetical protein
MMARKGYTLMHPRRLRRGFAPQFRLAPLWLAPASRRALRLAALAAAGALAAGCGHPAASASGAATTPAAGAQARTAAPAVTYCGTARTPANVPVKVEITHGTVTCPAALAVEHAYTAAVAAGKAPGNGGGGPVEVSGWQCEGFATPVMLQTGDVSKCLRGPAEILTILPPPPA